MESQGSVLHNSSLKLENICPNDNILQNPYKVDETQHLLNIIANIDQEILDLIRILSDKSVSSHDVFFAISIAVIGAFSAFMFNLFYWQYTDSKHKKARFGQKLDELINELEKEAVSYWINEDSLENRHSFQISEAKIIYLLRLIIKFQQVQEKKRFFNKNTNELERFSELTRQLYDFCTGGEFQTFDRKKDIKRAGEISKCCADAKLIIMDVYML